MSVHPLHYVHPADDPRSEELLADHVRWLLDRLADGFLLASGPVDDAPDGSRRALLVVRADDADAVVQAARTDPSWQAGLVGDHRVEAWDPVFGAFDADSSRAGQVPGA